VVFLFFISLLQFGVAVMGTGTGTAQEEQDGGRVCDGRLRKGTAGTALRTGTRSRATWTGSTQLADGPRHRTCTQGVLDVIWGSTRPRRRCQLASHGTAQSERLGAPRPFFAERGCVAWDARSHTGRRAASRSGDAPRARGGADVRVRLVHFARNARRL
jgi:hypothetical protein